MLVSKKALIEVSPVDALVATVAAAFGDTVLTSDRDAIATALPEVDLAQLDKLQTYARGCPRA
jgi:hypothetical protein